MDYQQTTQDQHPLPGEADGRSLADYRPLQTSTGRQTGVRQNELLVDVQEAENGDDSLRHRESHLLPLWTALIRNFGTFKRDAHRERESGIGTYQHCDHTDLRQNHQPKT